MRHESPVTFRQVRGPGLFAVILLTIVFTVIVVLSVWTGSEATPANQTTPRYTSSPTTISVTVNARPAH